MTKPNTITRGEVEDALDRIESHLVALQANLRERFGADVADELTPALQAIDQAHDELQSAPALTSEPQRAQALGKILGAHLGG